MSKRKEVEDAYYNFATTECDMEEDATNDKIAKARSEPHKNARLQSIHEAHQAVLSKEAEISAAEADLAAYEAQYAKENKSAALDGGAQLPQETQVVFKCVYICSPHHVVAITAFYCMADCDYDCTPG